MVTAENKINKIGKWLQFNLNSLQDKNNRKVFKKVLLGFDSDKIKNFGDGVIATTYITGVGYAETFGVTNRPVNVNSVVGFIIKGTTEARYDKATLVMDLLIENFETNKEWLKLETPERIVRDTDVIRSDFTLSPNGKKLDIIGLIELRHHVFK